MPAEESARLAAMYDLDNDAPRSDGGHGLEDVEWFRALARRIGGPVLELGCGTGRIAVPIAEDGHRVVGLDRSTAMLDRGRRRAGGTADVDYRESDIRDFELGETFRLILVPFNTLLMLEPGERLAFLSNARRHLVADGRLAVDVFQPDPHAIAGGDGVVVEEWTRDDPVTGLPVTKFTSSRATIERTIISIRYEEMGSDRTVRRLQRRATLHHVYRREAELLFASAGLAIESIHGDYDGSPADEHGSRLLIIARRRPPEDAG